MTTPSLIGASKKKLNKESQKKARKKPKTKGKLNTIVFVMISIGTLAGAYFYFSSYKSEPIAERFYTDRKALLSPQKQSSGKKAAEKNIFLQ